MLELNDYMYVIRANKKMNWYIGFTNNMNTYIDRVEHCAQNELEFALYFNEKSQANRFLEEYFANTDVKEENKKFYEVTCVKAENIDNGIFMYGVPCYFSKEAFKKWRLNPSAYSTKKAFV